MSYLHSDAGGALWNATRAPDSRLNLDKGKATIECARGSGFAHVDWTFSSDGLCPTPVFSAACLSLYDAVVDHSIQPRRIGTQFRA